MSAKPSPSISANCGKESLPWVVLPQFTGAARLLPRDSRTLPAPEPPTVTTSARPSPLTSATANGLNVKLQNDPPLLSADPATTGGPNPLPFEKRTTVLVVAGHEPTL